MISGIVLAAGTSSRLGRPKQLLELEGRPLLQHVVDAVAAAALDETIVVLGHESATILAALVLPDNVRAVLNERYSGGQSTSLAVGLAAVDPASDAVVIVLGDQPEMSEELIARAVRRFEETGAPMVRSLFGGAPGHPVVVARSHWGVLTAASGDRGARDELSRSSALVEEVEMGEPLIDVDTAEDYDELRRRGV